jgi:serine/threonine protein kinase
VLASVRDSEPPSLPAVKDGGEHWSEDFRDFLRLCLQKSPDSRPSAAELLQHPFVAGVPLWLQTPESGVSDDPSSSSQQRTQKILGDEFSTIARAVKEHFSKLGATASDIADLFLVDHDEEESLTLADQLTIPLPLVAAKVRHLIEEIIIEWGAARSAHVAG